jgi:membrane protein YdbS with pleckstrin-like domain
MPRSQHASRTSLTRRVVYAVAILLLWLAVTGAIVYYSGNGWKDFAIGALPVFGSFGIVMLALFFGPYRAVRHRSSSTRDE